MKKVLLKDIAEKAGVSTTLVSFVLNDKEKKYRVGEDTARLIRRIAAEMNYTPNVAARNMRNSKTGIIGLVVPDISNPFFAQISRIVENTAGRLGYTVFFASADESPENFKTVVWGLINRGVEGIIVVPSDHSRDTVEQMVLNKIPLVLLDRVYSDLDTDYVMLDNYDAGYRATGYLIGAGYRKAGMLAYDMDMMHMRERIRGYKAAMTEAGLEGNINVGYVDQHQGRIVASVAETLARMLAEGVDALFFASNKIAVPSLSYLNKAGTSKQPGLVGFDGGEAFELLYSPLSYLRQPIDKLAGKAVEMLVERINDDTLPTRQVLVEGELVVNDIPAGE